MQRYFFHLHNDVEASDEEGTVFEDLAAAKKFAVQQIRSLVAASVVSHGRFCLSHRIDIESKDGDVIASVTFGDAVTAAD